MSIASEPKQCPKCRTSLPGDAPQGLCPKCLLAAASIPTEAGQPAPDKTPPSLAELAAAFPQLEILELIGQGGMGFVFKARQPKLDRFVALKILPQSLAADPAFAERFSREGRVLAKLNHPNIVTVHDFGVAAGILPAVEPGFQPGGKSVENSASLESSEAIASSSANPGGRMPPSTSGKMPDATAQPQFFYLLMEFVDGVNLRQAMRAGRFTPDQALAIVPKICEALQFAHNEGILHRDIKPENILLDAKGRVKIADFGIAKLVGDVAQASQPAGSGGIPAASSEVENTGLGSPVNPQAGKPALHSDLTEAGKALGTPNYMAPEQRECSGEVDHRADIYSLGVVFYEMLTGELPLGRFAPPSEKSTADPRVDEVVLRALEKEKAKRYASADEVKTQVETIAATPPGSSRREEAQTEKPASELQKSQMVRLVELLSGIAFTSWRAVFLVNLSALGFLGFLSCLSYLPFPAAHYFKAFAGAFGLFGLIGAAFAFEFRTRRKAATSPGSSGRESAQTASSETPESQSRLTSAATDREPRFSRTAIVGAVWAFFFALSAGKIVMAKMFSPAEFASSEFCWLLGVLGQDNVGFTALFGTTILGWVAVAQIRRSAGKLYGLGLAVFDGLLFPLLALDVLIGGIWFVVLNLVANIIPNHLVRDPRAFDHLLIGVLFVLSVLSAALVDWLIIRRVWRAVNKAQTTPNSGVSDGPAREKARGLPYRKVLIGAACLLVLAIAGVGVYGCREQKADQLRLDKQARLIEQMSGPIDEHLDQGGMKRSILSFGFTSDGLCGSVTAENLRSTSKAEPDKLITKEGRLHCFDRGGGDWWVQGEGPLRQVAFAMKGEHLARSETAAFRDVTAQYTLSEPYPTRTLTCASNGREIQIPDLFAVLPLVRQMPEYKAWLKVRSVQTFFMTTRSDYRFEVYFMGRVRTPAGKEVDWIHDVVLFRPDRTRLASVALGNPEMILYDGSGEKVLAHINWTRALGDPRGVAEDRVSSLEVAPNTANERVWKVDEHAVIQDEKYPFIMLPDLENILGKPAAKADKPDAAMSVPVVSTNYSFGPVMERVVNDISERQGCEALRLASGQVLSLPASARDLGARHPWMEANQADLLLDFNANQRLTLTAGIKLADFQSANWDIATPNDLAKALQNSASGLSQVAGSGEQDFWLTKQPATPVTLAFETASGQRGLLQITGFTENPRGVKIRYKLVQSTNAPSSP